jgi:hypothetical protein
MRLPTTAHLEPPWRVSTLAPDFELLDVWRYPIELDESVPLGHFIDFMQASQRDLASSRGAAGALFRLRAILGKIFGWDGDGDGDGIADEKKRRPTLPIPGCAETSLCDRLTDADREKDLGALGGGSGGGRRGDVDSSSSFRPVYRFENESLLEISNDTVHAMMHLGRVSISATQWSPQLGVYVKPRGRLGPFYMSLISPFRHYIVYPAMMRAAKKGWPEYAAARTSPSP